LRTDLRSGLIVLSVLLVLWGFVLATGVGIRADRIGWYEPGAPLLPVQAWLAWGLALLFLLVYCFLRVTPVLKGLDLLIMLLLWLAAIWIWDSQPMLPNFFAPRPIAPTYTYYPYSDALGYDLTSHRVLLGIKEPLLPSKPLYSYFLAGLRAVQGVGYEEVVRLQIVVLALFPVLIYSILSVMHHRVAAFFAALLIIFREANALQLSGVIKVAHSKLLLSDLPTAVFFAFVIWVVVLWLRKVKGSETPALYPSFVLGALLGFSLLLRPQTTVLIPTVGLFVMLVFLRRPLFMLKSVALMLAGVIIAFSGWAYYSIQHTGFILLNDPWQTAYMTSVYHLSPDVVDMDVNRIPRHEGETLGDYNTRVQRSVTEFTFHYPQVVAQFVSAHFFHNQIESLLILPMSPFWVYHVEPRLIERWQEQWSRLMQDCCSPRAYLKIMPFWGAWNVHIGLFNVYSMGELTPVTFLSLCFNLAMVAFGIGVIWNRQRTLMVFALLLNITYIFSSAMGRQSGWRFMLPVDWIVVMFYAVGLTELTFWGISIVYKQPRFQAALMNETISTAGGDTGWSYIKWSLTLLLVVLISWSFNLTEWFIPVRYTPKSTQELLATYSRPNDTALWQESGFSAFEGRAMYPRYYRAGQLETTPPWMVDVLPFENRLAFQLLGSKELWVVLSQQESPEEMKHGADVLVIGCVRDSYIEAKEIVLRSPNNTASFLLAYEKLNTCSPSP